MRYEKGRRAASRERIVSTASRRFRKDGVAGVGIAGVMAEAGLTVGAFSGHFGTKEQLLREVLIDALGGQEDGMARGSLAQIVSAYLSVNHRDAAENGCITAALAPEISRQSIETRQLYTDRLLLVIEGITEHLPGMSPDAARRLGLTIFAQLIGSLQLSRAVADETLSMQVLEDGVEAALKLARSSSSPTT